MLGDLSTVKVGYNSFRMAAASLMFRKDIVLAALGGFDETRKGADTEFAERITAVFGEEATSTCPRCSSSRSSPRGRCRVRTSRSGGTTGRASSTATRSGSGIARSSPAGRRRTLDPEGPRQFPAPARFLTGRKTAPRTCDVLWISDWRSGIGRYGGASAQVEAVGSAGLSTVVAHATAVRHADRDRLHKDDDIMRLQAEGLTRFAIWAEPLHARVLFVTDPELLALTRPPDSIELSADRMIIVAGHPPSAPHGRCLTYDPASVERNAARMFQTEPEWLPAHGDIADELRAQGATSTILAPHPLRVVPRVRRRQYTGVAGWRAPDRRHHGARAAAP